MPLPPPLEDGGREWSDEGPTFLLFLPLAQAFFGGGANLMISSSEGCRIMSGGKKGCVQGQKSREAVGRLTDHKPLFSQNSSIPQIIHGRGRGTY